MMSIKMPTVNVSRTQNNLPRTTRGRLTPGQLFAKVIEGKVSTKGYAALGKNGKFYSINLANGELASATKPDAAVAVIGKFTWELSRVPAGAVRTCRRDQVKNGELFIVRGGNNLYGHLGRLANGSYKGVNIASGDTTITANGASMVDVVGTYRMNAVLAA